MSAIRLSISNTNTFTLCGLAFHQVLKWYHRLVTTLGNLGNLGKREKRGFEASRKVEIQKNNASGCPDELFS